MSGSHAPPVRFPAVTAPVPAAAWRMHLAFDALREGGATVGELAARLGYRSQAAFARAFKRVVGMPPGAVRRGAAA